MEERTADWLASSNSSGARLWNANGPRRRGSHFKANLSVREAERKRIARDLNDGVGQLMIALSLAAKAGRIEEVQSVTTELVRQVQNLTTRLRPTQLDDFGLSAAIEQSVAEWSGRTGVAADVDTSSLSGTRLPAQVETVLFRIVQEALTNVAKHADAAHPNVVVGRRGGVVSAIVEDDGRGFDPDAFREGHWGLVGIRERIALVGGELRIESSPNGGTTILARIPPPDATG